MASLKNVAKAIEISLASHPGFRPDDLRFQKHGDEIRVFLLHHKKYTVKQINALLLRLPEKTRLQLVG